MYKGYMGFVIYMLIGYWEIGGKKGRKFVFVLAHTIQNNIIVQGFTIRWPVQSSVLSCTMIGYWEIEEGKKTFWTCKSIPYTLSVRLQLDNIWWLVAEKLVDKGRNDLNLTASTSYNLTFTISKSMLIGFWEIDGIWEKFL